MRATRLSSVSALNMSEHRVAKRPRRHGRDIASVSPANPSHEVRRMLLAFVSARNMQGGNRSDRNVDTVIDWVEALELAREYGSRVINVAIWMRNYQTPLHLAVGCGNPEYVQCLCMWGGDVDASDDRGYTPLMKALELIVWCEEEEGEEEGGEEGGEEGAVGNDENMVWNERTLVGRRRKRRSLFSQCGIYLLRNGASLLKKDHHGYTSLHRAAMAGNVPVLKEAIVQAKVHNLDLDTTDRMGATALLLAVRAGQPQAARLLLEAGSCPTKTDFVDECAVSEAMLDTPEMRAVFARFCG